MQLPGWQHELKAAFTDLDTLCDFLELEKKALDRARQDTQPFGLRVPRGYAALMRKGDPRDPLLLQVLPGAMEQQQRPGFTRNPVGDLQAQARPGLLHKYHGRALVVATGACAVHCRYCFRRHFPYALGSATPRQWQAILDYLRDDDSITEVILSGGDPLMLSDARLSDWLNDLNGIAHIKRLRLHTRLPVVLPQRVTAGLLDLLAASPLRILVVLHINHPREISPAVAEALARLGRSKTALLNQSVLLKGVNGSAEVLATLSERLFEAGVLPYYLHLLDQVEGAAHFEVDEPAAREIHRELLRRLPGYLVPKLVREIAGEGSKTPVGI